MSLKAIKRKPSNNRITFWTFSFFNNMLILTPGLIGSQRLIPQHRGRLCPPCGGRKLFLKMTMLLEFLKILILKSIPSVTNSSDGLIFVKRRAKDGRLFSKNTGIRRAKRRAKFKLCIKKARKFDVRRFNDKSA